MEDTLELYSNLPGTDLSEEIDKLKDQNNLLHEHIESLESDIEKLCSKITEMKNVQTNLTKNISELYKTAKAEIDRKDRMLNELRNKLEESEAQRNSLSFALKRKQEFGSTNKPLSNQQHSQNSCWPSKGMGNKPGNAFPPREQSGNQSFSRHQQFQNRNRDYRDRNRFHPTCKSLEMDKRGTSTRFNKKKTLPKKQLSNKQVDERRIKASPNNVEENLSMMFEPLEKCTAELGSSDFSAKKQPKKFKAENRSNKIKDDNIVANVQDQERICTILSEGDSLDINNENIDAKHTENSTIIKNNQPEINTVKQTEQHNALKRQKTLEQVALSLLKLQEVWLKPKNISSDVAIPNGSTETSQNEKKCSTECDNKIISATDELNGKKEAPTNGLISSEVLKKEKQLGNNENTSKDQEPMKIEDKTCQEKIGDQITKKDSKNMNVLESSRDVVHRRPPKRGSTTKIESLVQDGCDTELLSLKKEIPPSKKNVASPKKEVVSVKVESLSPKKYDPADVSTAIKQEVVTSIKKEPTSSPNKESFSPHTCEKQPPQKVLKEELPLPLHSANSTNIISDNSIKAPSCGRSTNFTPLKKRRKFTFSMID